MGDTQGGIDPGKVAQGAGKGRRRWPSEWQVYAIITIIGVVAMLAGVMLNIALLALAGLAVALFAVFGVAYGLLRERPPG